MPNAKTDLIPAIEGALYSHLQNRGFVSCLNMATSDGEAITLEDISTLSIRSTDHGVEIELGDEFNPMRRETFRLAIERVPLSPANSKQADQLVAMIA